MSTRFIPWLILLAAWFPLLAGERVPGRYIVELTGEPVAETAARLEKRAGLRGAAAIERRTRLRAEQQEARLGLEQRQARVLDSVETVANALVVEVSDDAAAGLASAPGVKRVMPVRKYRMLLDRAAALHRVNEAWSQIGMERAGQGIKIAIIDTGIDPTHPAFQDSSLKAPDSFPRATRTADLAYTSGKIVVARSYVSLLAYRDPDQSARDRVGHGTALAMVAAGATATGPLATITGVAPRAWLGNYKVFGTPGYNDDSTDAAILKAIDDAVADGMDIINLSLGDDLAPRLSDDISVQAVERASQAGVIVVVAAGNNGPDLNTMSSPATAPSVIAVGASTNDRTLAASLEVAGLERMVAVPGDGPTPSAPITATLADVAALDGDGLGCTSLPSGSLSGRIALVLRGACTFESKLNNAQRAGALAAVVYAAPGAPSPITMAVGAATLPAMMISNGDGVAVKQRVASAAGVAATARFSRDAVPAAGKRLADFSAAGPSVDLGVKPDLVATGTDMYVATQTLDPYGDLYDASGYLSAEGTSFSSPLVAGAAALIKSARPGLTVDQYRSLLIHTAGTVETAADAAPLGVQQTGGGVLDTGAALRSTVTAYPVSLGFGAGGSEIRGSRTLTLANVGSASEWFEISAVPLEGASAPAVNRSLVEVAPGSSTEVGVDWTASGLAAGTYQGWLSVTGTSSGTRIRVPYWYAVIGPPARITVLSTVGTARAGSVQRNAILFRVTDASGVPLADAIPEITSVSGGGVFRRLVSYDEEVPGVFGVDIQMGMSSEANVFRIRAGGVSRDVSIATP